MTSCQAERLRCPICANPDWHARECGEECTHCGLQVDDPLALEEARLAIPARLASGKASGQASDHWSLSAAAWRNAAWRYGFVLDGTDATRATAIGHDVTLAIMTSPAQADMAAALVRSLTFERVIVAIDAADAEPWQSLFGNARLIAAPLAEDFSAQRNRLQAAAVEGWVLQLDSDEMPDAALIASLGWLVAAAHREGLRSLGLPRRNLVDGEMSALYPDIQYRLNRADVRFASKVHERPVLPFAATSLALTGTIQHRLDTQRVRERTRLYAGMAADGAREEDETALLRPFDAIADR